MQFRYIRVPESIELSIGPSDEECKKEHFTWRKFIFLIFCSEELKEKIGDNVDFADIQGRLMNARTNEIIQIEDDIRDENKPSYYACICAEIRKTKVFNQIILYQILPMFKAILNAPSERQPNIS